MARRQSDFTSPILPALVLLVLWLGGCAVARMPKAAIEPVLRAPSRLAGVD